MSERIVVLALAAAAVAWTVLRSRAGLAPYRDRGCAGAEWRRSFPSASEGDIRAYLECFVDGMAISPRDALKFSPNDRVLDVYRALYGGRTPLLGDHMECETFLEEVGHRFNTSIDDLLNVWHLEVTLGELFAHATSNR